jgi:hypothetical protein
MASDLKIFSIYKVQNIEKYYLLRTERPGFSNVSQSEQDEAENVEQNKREHILKLIGETYESTGKTLLDFIGEFQGFPVGDKLYSKNGKIELDVYFLETAFGRPWIIVGTANSETAFLAGLNDDEESLGLKPIGQPKKISAIFITENDFDLS